MSIQRFSRIEVVENRGYTGAWVTETDHESQVEQVRRMMQTDLTVSAERAWLAAEEMRWACIAAVEVTMKANGWDETTIACTVAALREVQP